MQEKDKAVVTVIRPLKGWFHFNFKELWDYRELAYFFVWRELKIRYKQTAVGILWAVFQPFCAMVIFSIFFGQLGKMPSDGIPYPVFVFMGLLLWNYFSFGLSHASTSVVSNSNIIQKIYFPRLIIPISSSLIGLIDFCFSAVILLCVMWFYHYSPALRGLFYIPLLLLITFLSSVGIGCFFASLNVKYRDVQYVTPFFIQMFMFVTPVIYPVSIVLKKYKWFLYLNPMSAVIENSRSAILGVSAVNLYSLLYALILSIIIFTCGVIYFHKTERYFADII